MRFLIVTLNQERFIDWLRRRRRRRGGIAGWEEMGSTMSRKQFSESKRKKKKCAAAGCHNLAEEAFLIELIFADQDDTHKGSFGCQIPLKLRAWAESKQKERKEFLPVRGEIGRAIYKLWLKGSERPQWMNAALE